MTGRLVLFIAAVLVMASFSAANEARAQCYPGLACPPAATPQNTLEPQAPQRTPANAASETYRVLESVSEGVLNMRAGPSVDSRLIVAIPGNSRGLEVFRCASGKDGTSKFAWCNVKWQGYEGWVSSCCILGEQSSRRP